MESGGPTKPEDEKGAEQPPPPVGEPLGQPVGTGQPSRSQSLSDLVGSTGAQAPHGQPMSTPELQRALKTGTSRSVSGFVSFLPLLTALVFAVGWYFMEGLPFADHDEYGSVPVNSVRDKPEPTVVSIPEGKVYLYFEEGGLSDQDSVETPDNLAVEARPASAPRKSAPLKIEEVPSFLFSTKTDSTGWEPYGKLDTDGGDYSLTARAESGYGQITVGKPPINPFGPPVIGSILIFALGAALTFLIVSRRRHARQGRGGRY